MIILFLIGLLIGILAIVFALQNSAVVTIVFFGWQFTGSLSLILLLTILSGMMIVLFLVLPRIIGGYFKYRKLKKKNIELEEALEKQKELTLFAKKEAPTKEDLGKIENGVIDNDTE